MLLKNYKKLCGSRGGFKRVYQALSFLSLVGRRLAMAFIGRYFSYDGIDSDSMGVVMVRQSTDLIEVPFGYNRHIVEENIGYKDKPF